MLFPPILIVGSSGSGKSSSLEGLNPERTVVLNIERKMLPFKKAMKFKHNIFIPEKAVENPLAEYNTKFDQAIQAADIDVIVHESFTTFSDELLKFSKKINKGYDIYNYYSAKIIALLDKIKAVENKWNVVIAIDELVELMNPNGVKTTTRRCGVNGRELEGKIEKEFTIVFFTDVRQPAKDQPANHQFETNNDGTTSSKSPAGMFPKFIPNDVMKAIYTACGYWGMKPPLGEIPDFIKTI